MTFLCVTAVTVLYVRNKKLTYALTHRTDNEHNSVERLSDDDDTATVASSESWSVSSSRHGPFACPPG